MTMSENAPPTTRHPPPIPAIVGPTASGKSDLGIGLALELGGEIVNLDSVQVYRGIEVATAKVPLWERRGVPHHLIDLVEPTTNFTAGAWARAAATTIGEIEARGKVAILVGGTGFYLRALTVGLFEGPEVGPDVRARLKARLERVGAERLHRLLARLDPPTARRLPPRDASRVVRALEVRLACGRPLSSLHAERPPAPPSADIAGRVRVLALAPAREELYRRIDRRADRMFEDGLVDEVRGLLDAGVPPDAKALGAHGYRRVVEYLLGGRTLDSAIEQTKLDTRHYAKRQMTWWRGTPGVYWIEAFGESDEALAAALLYLRGDSQ
jgi:tRNA dimethylallyltransferase